MASKRRNKLPREQEAGDNGNCDTGLYASDSWCAELVLSGVTVVLLLISWMKRKADFFKDRGVPHISLWNSILVSFKTLTFQISMFDFMETIYDRIRSNKIGGYFQGTKPMFFALDPDLINRMLIKDFSHFHDHGFQVDIDANPLEGHLFNMEGQKWRALRNKLSPTFTSGKLKWMLPQISECADQLVLVLQKKTHGEDVLIRDYLSRFAIDVLASCAFGVEGGALNDPDCEFRRLATKIFKPSWVMRLKVMFRVLFPELTRRLKIRLVDPEVNDFFFNITRQAFEHRLKTGLRRNDFVDLLLQLKQKGWVDHDPEDEEDEEENNQEGLHPDTKLELTDGLLAAQSFVFLAAGWENTASAIGFTLLLLARNQEAQDRARAEIADVKKKYGGEITYAALKDMFYLDACLSESLRMIPPLPGLVRSCTKDYTLEDGVVIKKGTGVMMPIKCIQMDPAHFQDPELFLPERFLGKKETDFNSYLPFGAGPRICIARRFVLLEVKLVLAKLLEKFRFLNSTKIKEPIKMDRSLLIIDIAGGTWVRLQPIDDQ